MIDDVHANERQFAAYVAESALGVITSLGQLPADGQLFWLWLPESCLVRRLDADRYVAVSPRMFSWAVLWGRLDDPSGFADHWCYGSLPAAVSAAWCWDGTGEPTGWHRHPATGRRRPEGNPDMEYVAP